VPVVHEDDALRAVRAADELLRAFGPLNEELERRFQTRLDLRIGVNAGEVVTGTEERLATGEGLAEFSRWRGRPQKLCKHSRKLWQSTRRKAPSR
jgi:class 3 adenylate cyclase